MLIGMVSFPRSPRITGMTRSSSCIGVDRLRARVYRMEGRVDSPPTSTMSAPHSSNRSASWTAESTFLAGAVSRERVRRGVDHAHDESSLAPGERSAADLGLSGLRVAGLQ